jgi:hypothetical protein
MSFPKTQPKMEEQPLDEIDQLIRWALLDAVASEEPSPQVWQDIKARLMTRSRDMPSQSGVERLWRQFASALKAWTSAVLAPSEANWDPRFAPQTRSYLIWRESLLLSMMPTTAAIIH